MRKPRINEIIMCISISVLIVRIRNVVHFLHSWFRFTFILQQTMHVLTITLECAGHLAKQGVRSTTNELGLFTGYNDFHTSSFH